MQNFLFLALVIIITILFILLVQSKESISTYKFVNNSTAIAHLTVVGSKSRKIYIDSDLNINDTIKFIKKSEPINIKFINNANLDSSIIENNYNHSDNSVFCINDNATLIHKGRNLLTVPMLGDGQVNEISFTYTQAGCSFPMQPAYNMYYRLTYNNIVNIVTLNLSDPTFGTTQTYDNTKPIVSAMNNAITAENPLTILVEYSFDNVNFTSITTCIPPTSNCSLVTNTITDINVYGSLISNCDPNVKIFTISTS